ncbi:MAG: 4-hydroxy-3-methylbut-2-enyl diphosphate reductase [Bacteroidetes bacterium]|nr:4-hydroxy-3-methylbut-2-enyl diphosphate reductase [Bacteroidota bacterium]MBU1115866.1 4-hydroxy-3-methylbut-2-enyl diphosphate reductase [Bacteroidota bacterium]MBU1797980.1 4-hydroxy-3-methylbut-2-enyl diphosphate reductase [Bacteroidota bacterium]
MRTFQIPDKYRSSIISKIKNQRKEEDPKGKDCSPSILDFGKVRFHIARHFGFCFGVENAIEIAYKAINENSGKRIFLLSEMIHNPTVNTELSLLGVQFIQDTKGNNLIDWNELTYNDIVIIPAFGTTLEIEKKLNALAIDPYKYNTTCPFVEKVWNKSEELGKNGFTIIIHGKAKHEETRATFSHTAPNGPAVIIRDIEEAKLLSKIILGEIPISEFYRLFEGKYTQDFNAETDFNKIGVVNQTTMLASETEEISTLLKNSFMQKYGEASFSEHFANTRDTLCYATNNNQNATLQLMNTKVDLAIVVGGYNSSNTSHIVELLEEKFKTYFISDETKLISKESISHFDLSKKEDVVTNNFLPNKEIVDIAITSGASCPDATVDKVIKAIVAFFE